MFKKPGIPSKPLDPFSKAIREILETITGQRGGKFKPLEQDASLSDVIKRINEITELLQ